MDFGYSYKAGSADSGVVRSRTDRVATGGAVTQGYSYDGRNRVTRAKETRGDVVTASWSYCYDPNGNRVFDSTSTSAAATVACPGSSGGPAASYTYDATNTLTGRASAPASAFGYDANGAETAGVGAGTRTNGKWSPRMQLTGVDVDGAAHSFGYAGEGNKERTVFDQAGYQNTALGVTTQTGTGANTVVREPDGTPVALRTGGKSYYFVADRQGSTISLVDAGGVPRNAYSYDPYGVSRSKTEPVANRYQYIGGQYDTTTGLYHLQARYYDPTLGRFTQPDPSGQEANTYLYSSAKPIMMSDPTGLGGWKDVGAVAGGIVSAGVGAGICAATAIVGCVAAGAVVGASLTTAGGFLGAAAGNEDVTGGDVGLWAGGGALSGASSGIGGWIGGLF